VIIAEHLLNITQMKKPLNQNRMGKIIIKFDSVEEAQDVRDALDGYKWKIAVQDIDQMLRNRIKYDDQLPEDVSRAFETLRDNIREILSGYHLVME
jgi:hypothetical protein